MSVSVLGAVRRQEVELHGEPGEADQRQQHQRAADHPGPAGAAAGVVVQADARRDHREGREQLEQLQGADLRGGDLLELHERRHRGGPARGGEHAGQGADLGQDAGEATGAVTGRDTRAAAGDGGDRPGDDGQHEDHERAEQHRQHQARRALRRGGQQGEHVLVGDAGDAAVLDPGGQHALAADLAPGVLADGLVDGRARGGGAGLEQQGAVLAGGHGGAAGQVDRGEQRGVHAAGRVVLALDPRGELHGLVAGERGGVVVVLHRRGALGARAPGAGPLREVAVGEAVQHGVAHALHAAVDAGAVERDEQAGALARARAGVELEVRVEEVGVAAVADDPVAVAALVEEAQGHARAVGQAAELLGVERALVHELHRGLVQQRRAAGLGAEVGQHEAGHVGGGGGQRAGGRGGDDLERLRDGVGGVVVAAGHAVLQAFGQGLLERGGGHADPVEDLALHVLLEPGAGDPLDQVAGEGVAVVRVRGGGARRVHLRGRVGHQRLAQVRGDAVQAEQVGDALLETGGVGEQVAGGDGGVELGGEVEVEVLLDVGVQVDLARLDLLHDGGGGDQLGHRTGPEQVLLRVDRGGGLAGVAVLAGVGEPVAARGEDLAVVDDGDRGADDPAVLQTGRDDAVEPGVDVGRGEPGGLGRGGGGDVRGGPLAGRRAATGEQRGGGDRDQRADPARTGGARRRRGPRGCVVGAHVLGAAFRDGVGRTRWLRGPASVALEAIAGGGGGSSGAGRGSVCDLSRRSPPARGRQRGARGGAGAVRRTWRGARSAGMRGPVRGEGGPGAARHSGVVVRR